MDLTRFEVLEAHVVDLVQAYARTKEENRQFGQQVKQLQDALHIQQQDAARLRLEQEELTHLRTVMQTLQQERDTIRQKLEQMLVTIEWLEGRVPTEGRTQA